MTFVYCIYHNFYVSFFALPLLSILAIFKIVNKKNKIVCDDALFKLLCTNL